MRHAFRRISIIAVTVSAALLGMSQPSATAAPVGPAAVAAPAPAGGEGGIESTASPEGEVTPASHICTFLTKGDNVHISSTAFEASGHGWWVKVSCAATSAVVTVQLQQYYSDGAWRVVGTVGRATVPAGGGGGKRATGRAACLSSALTGWRSVVDVDIVGYADTADKYITPAVNIYRRR